MLPPVARGGTGEVWVTAPMDSPDPSRLCLLTCIKSDLGGDAEPHSRFFDDANDALALRGQHLCHVSEAGAGSGQHFLAMELIEGVTLRQLGDTSAKESPLSTKEAVPLAVWMLRGLQEAHDARSPTTGELLTADRFYGDPPSRAVWGIVGSGQHRPRSWHLVRPGVAPVLARTLAARPADRFPDCDTLATALLHAVTDAAGASTAARLEQRVRAASADQQAQIAHARELRQLLRPDFDAFVPESARSMTLRVRDQGRVVRPTVATSTTNMASVVLAPMPGAAQVFTAAKPAPRARNRWLAAAVVAAGALAGATVVAVQGLTTTPPAAPTPTTPSTTAPTPTTPSIVQTSTTTPPATNTNAENAAATTKNPSGTTARNATATDAASTSGNARRAREIETKLLAADAGCSCRTATLGALAKARGRGDDAVGIWLLTVQRCLDKCGLH
jgi:hypothetical protein